MYKKKIKTYMTVSMLVASSMFAYYQTKEIYASSTSTTSTVSTKSKIEENQIMLSDIPYDSATSTNKNGVKINQNLGGNNLCLTIDGAKTYFKKGIAIHTNGNIVYDIRNFSKEYTKFSSYVGVDDSQRNKSCDGVIFRFYKSDDKKTWSLIHQTDVIRCEQEGVFVTFDVTGVTYLKLVTDRYQTDYNDHAIFCWPSLLKADYKEPDLSNGFLPSLSTLQKEIQSYPATMDLNNSDELRYKVLQYTFMKRVGMINLQQIYSQSVKNQETIQWLFQDSDTLSLFLNGGNPEGTYENAIDVLGDLLHTYKEDLFDAESGAVYKKMMIALSLTHSQPVKLWTGKTTQSNACVRYQIFKKLRTENKLIDKNLYDQFPIEDLRWIMNNWIDDVEIEWINFYARKKGQSAQKPVAYELNPYSYITYRFGYQYSAPQYYSTDNYQKWNEKYYLEQFNIPYGTTDDHKLWMVFEEGGVCGALSKTGSNLQTSFGIPSVVIGQPGHAAYVVYKQDPVSKKGMWEIWNNISSWKGSARGERLLNGWGTYLPHTVYNVSYILLAQAVLDNYQTYATSQEYRMWANIYDTQAEQYHTLLKRSIGIQTLNYDAWNDMIASYVKNPQTTEKEYLDLSQQLIDTFKWYPLPLYDMLVKRIRPHLTSIEMTATLDTMLETALKQATTVKNTDLLQPSACKEMANYLLGVEDLSVAKFSFDGEDANKIILSDKYKNSMTTMHFSLDGGVTWSEPTSEKEVLLSEEELKQISTQYGILIQLVGSNSTYKIDILQGEVPKGLVSNDLENMVIGINDTYEWSLDSGITWNSYKNGNPDLSNEKEVFIRRAATGTSLASASVSFRFTTDSTDESMSYISIRHLSIAGYSSQETGRAKNYAANVIDGNPNTIWHTLWNKSDKERYISLQVDYPTYLTALEYVPRMTETNGIITNATILVSLDGEEWTAVGSDIIWANNSKTKLYKFQEPIPARFVKLVGTKANNDFCSAAMINLYEDKTKTYEYDIHISYDISTLTNQDVVATCVLPNGYTVKNGENTHTFNENGTYDFYWENEHGESGVITANVNWIDKTPPTATVQYDITAPTNEDVCAILVDPSEEINILNMPSEETLCYTFTQNGQFEFQFVDKAGNMGTALAVVDWIDKTPLDAVLEYSTTTSTTEPVVVSIIQANKDYTVLNNNGQSSFVFEKNGIFTFDLVDEYGNSLSLTAKVDWIIEKNEKPDENKPVSGENKPESGENKPVSGENKPVSGENKPSGNQSSTNNKKPVSNSSDHAVIPIPTLDEEFFKKNDKKENDSKENSKNDKENSYGSSSVKDKQNSSNELMGSFVPQIVIKNTKDKSTLTVGKKYTLTIKYKPKKATYKWVSSNKKIATVSSKGVVTGKKAGKVKIQCTIKVGKKVQKISRVIYIKSNKKK